MRRQKHIQNRWWPTFLMPVTVVLAAACGSEVIVESPVDDDAPPVAAGGNPPSPVNGGGGSSTVTTTTTTTTTAGGGSGKLCGDGQPPCPPSEFCDYPEDSCGPQGTCTPRPQSCPDDCPDVCGCDGVAYCNECLAQASGVDVSANCTE